MAKSHFIPRTDKERAAWLKNFSVKFATYALSVGFTAADVTAVAADSAYFNYIIDVLEVFKAEIHERTAYKDILRDGPLGSPLGVLPSIPTLPTAPAAVPAGIFARISGIVKRIKAHPAYSDAIGKDLNIIGAEHKSSISDLKPLLEISKEGGNIIIKYKKSKMSGIRLMCKRGDETEFTMLSIVMQNKFKDTRPNLETGVPEIRKYCAWYIKNDELIGQMSDEVTFLV